MWRIVNRGNGLICAFGMVERKVGGHLLGDRQRPLGGHCLGLCVVQDRLLRLAW